MKKRLGGLVDENSNVITIEREDDSIALPREPTGMELRCATVLYETHTGYLWDDIAVDSVQYWIWVKTARAMIQEMRTLSYDIVQKVRGKPFHNAKDIWETIIDECSPS